MSAIDAGRQWIVFPRWDGKDGFQHYRNRDPVWIKNYTRLTSSDEYRALSFSDRGLLHGLWLEYARSGRALTRDTAALGRRLGQRVLSEQLERLNRAGFLTFSASRPLAPCYPDASPEKEGEVREEPPTPAEAGDSRASGRNPRARGTNPRAQAEKANAHICPRCDVHFKAQTLLDEHLYTSHDGPEPEHWRTPDEPPPASPAEDPDLPPPEERARIAAELRESLGVIEPVEVPRGNGVVPAEELPWEGDEPPVLT